MIKNSFIFLEKIGARKEQKLWQSGIKDWPTFLATKNIPGTAPIKKSIMTVNCKKRKKPYKMKTMLIFGEECPLKNSGGCIL